MHMHAAIILAVLAVTPALAQDSRYVTFKTVRDEFGRTEHQIDRGTIKQEGLYKVFWSRISKNKEPVAISSGGQLYIWSQKFAVDCAQHRITARFIDSTAPHERKRNADLKTVKWNGLEKNPTAEKAVCGGK